MPCRRSAWSRTTPPATTARRRSRRARRSSAGQARSGAGTATRSAPALQPRPPCGCSSANRLAALKSQAAEAAGGAAASLASRAIAEDAERQAAAAEAPARAARREAESRAERARAAAAQLRTQAATAATRLQAAEQQIARLLPESEDAAEALSRARALHAELPDIAALRAALEHARAALAAARAREMAARSARDTLAREHDARARRRVAIAAERADWAARARQALERVGELAARRADAAAEQDVLEAEPARIAARRAEAIEELERAEGTHRCAAEALGLAIARQEAADRAARSAEAALAACREAAVRAEGEAALTETAWESVLERILERLGASPALPEPPADLTAETEDKARRRLDRLVKEREEMGPVNLVAEIEAADVEKQIAAIAAEREELASAIAKLRGSIGHLNREGRERLSAVFQAVDRHFQALFTRMFGGGRAHLALVGSDDPLEAGLEIYAQPPGKKLATLSLLSGGEQALTALSLIFAVFRCNPAPICVLDEVDAPLDDANVERFCNLLDDMVRETGTRFLVVTHHHLTMARMDRLYGVTMQERGVSRLLSVDLRTAGDLVAEPRIAAE